MTFHTTKAMMLVYGLYQTKSANQTRKVISWTLSGLGSICGISTSRKPNPKSHLMDIVGFGFSLRHWHKPAICTITMTFCWHDFTSLIQTVNQNWKSININQIFNQSISNQLIRLWVNVNWSKLFMQMQIIHAIVHLKDVFLQIHCTLVDSYCMYIVISWTLVDIY